MVTALSEYRQTIKNLAKVRVYMRDLYLYGFRTRRDFDRKSARTYDNERRRIENWLGEYIRFDHSSKGKSICISLDSASAPTNPLFVAWKSKSFTDNDIVLHFLLLDALGCGQAFSAPELTELLCEQYNTIFDLQTVRGKLREYEREGLLLSEKQGKTIRYSLYPMSYDDLPCRSRLDDAVAFFSHINVGGYIGNTLFSGNKEYTSPFRFKHWFIAHTLDDGIVLELLEVIRQKKMCRIFGTNKRAHSFDAVCVPLRILDSVQTGRRYVVAYEPRVHRLVSLRIDCIDSIEPMDVCPEAEKYLNMADRTAPRRWGVSYSGTQRIEQLCVKLRINQRTEQYVLDRIRREGRGGELLCIDSDTYLYTVEVYDSNEVMPWIKTFTGRIISLEGTNSAVVDKFYRDMRQMAQMYAVEDSDDGTLF